MYVYLEFNCWFFFCFLFFLQSRRTAWYKWASDLSHAWLFPRLTRRNKCLSYSIHLTDPFKTHQYTGVSNRYLGKTWAVSSLTLPLRFWTQDLIWPRLNPLLWLTGQDKRVFFQQTSSMNILRKRWGILCLHQGSGRHTVEQKFRCLKSFPGTRRSQIHF